MRYNVCVKPMSTLSSFEAYMRNGLFYVDKTEFAYNMLRQRSAVPFFFLARPRRWGKTLMVSTLEAALRGRRELFDGLFLGASDYGFEPCPVIRLDMSQLTVSDPIEETRSHLTSMIAEAAAAYGVSIDPRSAPGNALQMALSGIAARGKGCAAILIDEYDTPLQDSLYLKDGEPVRDMIRNFYARLKPCSDLISFLFITGVTRMNNQSIFSKLNNLRDLTFDPDYSSIAGYTQIELERYFTEGFDEFSAVTGRDREWLIGELERWYDGYRFADGAESVYNPVSINSFFDMSYGRMRFGSYWASTASSRMIYDLARRHPFMFLPGETKRINEGVLQNFMIEDFASDAFLSEEQVYGYLYLAGYLTMDRHAGRDILLRIPDHEVELVICEVLARLYVEETHPSIADGLRKALSSDDMDAFSSGLRDLLLIPPYDARVSLERYYQSLIYVVLRLMDGVDVRCEAHTANGRADLIVQYGHRLIVIELKLNGSAEDAIAQIEDRRYWEGSGLSGRDVYLLGINIDDSDNLSISWIGKRL